MTVLTAPLAEDMTDVKTFVMVVKRAGVGATFFLIVDVTVIIFGPPLMVDVKTFVSVVGLEAS